MVGPENRHAVRDDDLVGLGQLAVAAALGRQIDDHRSGRHALHHLPGDQHRRALAGNRRGGDDDVAAGDDFGHHLALAAVERLVLRLGVAALVLGVAGFKRQLDELRADALHLLLGGGPHVVGLHRRAEPPRGGDRLQPRHAGADDEHARGLDGAGRGGEHGKHARQVAGGQQHGLVAGHGRHRRQRVHALRARDARHQLHRQRRDAARRQRRGQRRLAQRIEKGDDGLPRARERKVGVARRRAWRRDADAQQQLGTRHDVGGRRRQSPRLFRQTPDRDSRPTRRRPTAGAPTRQPWRARAERPGSAPRDVRLARSRSARLRSCRAFYMEPSPDPRAALRAPPKL